jgi:hypothetical protein
MSGSGHGISPGTIPAIFSRTGYNHEELLSVSSLPCRVSGYVLRQNTHCEIIVPCACGD